MPCAGYLGLAIVLALAILPPALDEKTVSEQRRADATRIDDPEARKNAEFRAGAIDGCTDGAKREIAGTAQAKTLDVDSYCSCYINQILGPPGDDQAQLQAAADAIQSGRPTRRMEQVMDRCIDAATSDA